MSVDMGEYIDRPRDPWGYESPFGTEAPFGIESPIGTESPFGGEDEEEAEAEAEREPETGAEAGGVAFPSGTVLRVTSGATGRDEEHWDPNGTGQPLLDTGPSVRGLKVSQDFTVGEFASSGGRASDIARISPALVIAIQAIRDRAGKPVKITSGYRSWSRNKALYAGYKKKVTLSRHCSGQAVDIRIAGLSGAQIAKLAIDAAGTDLGIGVARTFAHIDVRGVWTLWNYGGVTPEVLRDVRAYRDARRRGAAPAPVPPAPRPPVPAPPQPAPVPSTPGRTGGGRLTVDRVPVLAPHRGAGPDLVMRWNAMQNPEAIDVVVHLHGYSAPAAAMRLPRDKEPISGLDFSDPAGREAGGRTRPTLALLPRGKSAPSAKRPDRYTFPALTPRGALRELVRDGLARFAAHTGISAPLGQLILTAHSGGGAPLTEILTHTDPDEVHVFDALYGPAGPVAAWARRRIARELSAPGAVPPALRVVYLPGGKGTTGPSSRALEQDVCLALTAPGGSRLATRFRVESTGVPHNDIPRAFGWRLLADPSADLPKVRRAVCAGDRGTAGEAEAWAGEGWSEGPEGESEGWEGEGWGEAWEAESSGEAWEAAGTPTEAWAGTGEGEAWEAEASEAEGWEAAADETQAWEAGPWEAGPWEAEAWEAEAEDPEEGAPAEWEHAVAEAGHGDDHEYGRYAGDHAEFPGGTESLAAPEYFAGPQYFADPEHVADPELLGDTEAPSGPDQLSVSEVWSEAEAEAWPESAAETDSEARPCGCSHGESVQLDRGEGWPGEEEEAPAPVTSTPNRRAGVVPYARAASQCSGHEQRGARALADQWRRLSGGRAGTYVCRTIRGRTAPSVHGDGRAVDAYAMAADPVQRARMEAYIRWLMANAVELQVAYIIWNRRQWSWKYRSQGWRPYKGVSPHTDHAHIELSWEGALTPSPLFSGGVPGLGGAGAAPGPNPAPPQPSKAKPSRQRTVAEFLRRFGAFARASQAATGVPALVTLGQAAIESGWGRHAPRNNFFGIKARAGDPEETRQLLRTREVLSRPDVTSFPEVISVTPRPDGKYDYVVRAWFRAYPDPAAAFIAHGTLLRRNKRYAAAFSAPDPYAFATAVARAGYATAPSYASAVHSAMRSIEAAGWR